MLCNLLYTSLPASGMERYTLASLPTWFDESGSTKITRSMDLRKNMLCIGLVYYELADDMMGAITREKQIKGGSRAKKLALIETANPEWRDLYEELLG